eukprot:82125_1
MSGVEYEMTDWKPSEHEGDAITSESEGDMYPGDLDNAVTDDANSSRAQSEPSHSPVPKARGLMRPGSNRRIGKRRSVSFGTPPVKPPKVNPSVIVSTNSKSPLSPAALADRIVGRSEKDLPAAFSPASAPPSRNSARRSSGGQSGSQSVGGSVKASPVGEEKAADGWSQFQEDLSVQTAWGRGSEDMSDEFSSAPGSIRPSSPATIMRARTSPPPTTASSRWFRRGLERVRSVKERVLTQISQPKKDGSRLFKEVIKTTPTSSRASPKSEPSRRSSRKSSRESSRSGSSACSNDSATNARFFDGGAATVEELPKFRKSSSAPTSAKPDTMEAGEGAGGPGIHTGAVPGSVGDSVEMLTMDGGVETEENAVRPVIGKVIVFIHEVRTEAQRRPYLRCTLEDRLYKVYADRHKPEHGPIVLEFSLTDITADLYIELCGAHNLRPDTRFAGQVVFPVISLLTTFGVQEGGHCAWHAIFPCNSGNRDGVFQNAQDNVRYMGMKRPSAPLGALCLGVELQLGAPLLASYCTRAPDLMPPAKRANALMRFADAISDFEGSDMLSIVKFKYNRARVKRIVRGLKMVKAGAKYIISWKQPELSLPTFIFLSWLTLLSQPSAWPFVLLLTVAFFGVYTRCARTYGDIHAFRDEKDTSGMSRNARERIEKVTEAMTQVQGMTGSVATVAEKFINVASGEDPRTTLMFYTAFFLAAWFISWLLHILTIRQLMFLSFFLPMSVVPAKTLIKYARNRMRPDEIEEDDKYTRAVKRLPSQSEIGGGDFRSKFRIKSLRTRAKESVRSAKEFASWARVSSSNLYKRIPDEPMVAHRRICTMSKHTDLVSVSSNARARSP